MKILFIGGGNMAKAMIIGLMKNCFLSDNIYVVDRNEFKRAALQNVYHVHVSQDPAEFISIADVIVLAIKPQGAKEICCSLKSCLKGTPLIISVMAGITLDTLSAWLGEDLPIVRAAPNTPAIIQEGATGLFANAKVAQLQKEQVETIMKAIGIFAWVLEEKHMNIITMLSGSGPAYYFYFIEHMQKIALEKNLPADIAQSFALQTAYGATKLALENQGTTVEELRAQVTSKKGTTEAAIQLMQNQGLPQILRDALTACLNRASELSLEAIRTE